MPSLESSMVAIIDATGSSDEPVGAGVVFGQDCVLTCAHVVNAALGLSEDNLTRPSANAQIKLTFHASRNSPIAIAKIDPDPGAWSAPPASRSKGADLCVLKLSTSLPEEVEPAQLCIFSPLINRKCRAGGYPKQWSSGDIAPSAVIVGMDSSGLYMLRPDVKPNDWSEHSALLGMGNKRLPGLIYKGFSGGPVEIDGRIVGIVGEVRQKAREATSYMIPASTFPKIVQEFVGKCSELTNEYPHLDEMGDSLDDLCKTKGIASIDPFDIRLRVCNDFAAVLSVHRSRLIDDTKREADKETVTYVDGVDLTPEIFADRLIRRRNMRKKIILHAPGGAGKSSFLIQLMRVCPDFNLVPFFIDFSASTDDRSNPDQDVVKDARTLLEDWFNRYHGIGSAESLIECIKQSRSKEIKALLIVDGFNQAKLDLTRTLDKIFDMTNQILSGAIIIIADRMVDREIRGSFTRTVIAPLDFNTYSHLVPADIANDEHWRPILSSPLFLNIFREIFLDSELTQSLSDVTPPYRFSILKRYFDKCGFTKTELQVLAETAFKAYQSFGTTEIPKSYYERIISEYAYNFRTNKDELLNKITKHELVHDVYTNRDKLDKEEMVHDVDKQNKEVGKKNKEFRHQIIHDFLAALRVASVQKDEEESMLRAPAFDALTLNSASSDALELALEALQEPDQLLGKRVPPLTAHDLLTEVYDWNFWITLQCIMSFDRRGVLDSANSPIQPWLRHAVYALNLEKKFDIFLHTVARAEQLIKQIANSSNISYINCSSHKNLISEIDGILVSLINSELQGKNGHQKLNEAGDNTLSAEKKETYGKLSADYARQWKDIYTRENPFTHSDIDLLWRDPIIAWTAANVLRRLGLTPELTKEILLLYGASKSTSGSSARAAAFRWRLVHVLGRSDIISIRDPLMKVIFDPSEDVHVRYGAVRSVIEACALSGRADIIQTILGTLKDRLTELFNDEESSLLCNTEGRHKKRRVPLLLVRNELMRCCAINELGVSGQKDWINVWLEQGLSGYESLLKEGAQKATGKEAELWQSWAGGIKKVRELPTQDWSKHKAVWYEIIKGTQ